MASALIALALEGVSDGLFGFTLFFTILGAFLAGVRKVSWQFCMGSNFNHSDR